MKVHFVVGIADRSEALGRWGQSPNLITGNNNAVKIIYC